MKIGLLESTRRGFRKTIISHEFGGGEIDHFQCPKKFSELLAPEFTITDKRSCQLSHFPEPPPPIENTTSTCLHMPPNPSTSLHIPLHSSAVLYAPLHLSLNIPPPPFASLSIPLHASTFLYIPPPPRHIPLHPSTAYYNHLHPSTSLDIVVSCVSWCCCCCCVFKPVPWGKG